ncbi:RHS repeat-associated core domain-containing protein, partial [Prevotella denticola]
MVSNVLSVVNKAAIPEKGKAGGQMSYNYTYDALYRLSTASGTYKGADNKAASYTLSMGYDNMHRITSKKQHLSQTGVQFEGTLNAGYELAYTYGKDAGRKFQLDNVRDINYRTEETPTEGMNINNGHKYTYDLNGNLVYINTSRVKRDGKEDEKATEQKYRWDEENRLMVLSDNSKTSRYTYNVAGERIMKSYGTMEGVYINGAPQGITFHETDNFTLYPASILSVNKNRFTKHYFLGDKRVASRIGTGLFNNVYGRNGSYVTAGQQDYAERMNQIQKQKEEYYKQQGIAPGVPTMKGAYGDPENTGVGYNAVLTELGNHDVPQGWVQTPKPNTTPNTNPGPPVSWNDPSNPDDPQAGYGYIPNDTTKEETFFYHSDHLGSTSYITDDKGNITQYDAYLPYGELLVDEHSSSEDLPYKFNGKQFDEETGLYYYGARYMNPVTSLWYGVDPLAEKYLKTGAYVYCGGNPIVLKDPDGRGWIQTKKGIYYNPNIHSQKDISVRDTRRGFKYLGETYQNDKRGVSYRSDGSILFRHESDAY